MLPKRRGESSPATMHEKQPRANEFNWERGEIPESEVRYMTSRGGGPGGQGVNTTDSRVELRWTIGDSRHLSMEQKNTLRVYAKREARKRILEEIDELKFVCTGERSQLQNKQDCLNRLNVFLRNALMPEKKRKKTDKSKRVKQKERARRDADKRRKQARDERPSMSRLVNDS